MRQPRILVLQQSQLAPGGNFQAALTEAGGHLTVTTPEAFMALPGNPDAFDGLVVLGGPENAFDDQAGPHFQRTMDWMRAMDGMGRPVAGICLGCQLLARAHGGAFLDPGFLELGYVQHRHTEAGRRDPVVGWQDLPPLMEYHQDGFELPASASLLIRGERWPNQCFKVGRASYGFQFHLEADTSTVAAWMESFCKGEVETYKGYRDQFSPAWFEAMDRNLKHLEAASNHFCRRVARHWLEQAGAV